MDKVRELVLEMAKAVNESKEYGRYTMLKEQIKAEKSLYDAMKAFRKMHTEFQEKKIHQREISFEEECAVSRKYFELMQNSRASEFFEAEKEVIEMLSEIYVLFGSECKVELEF